MRVRLATSAFGVDRLAEGFHGRLMVRKLEECQLLLLALLCRD